MRRAPGANVLWAAALMGSFGLGGCALAKDQPEVARCEELILANIPNPESYQRGQSDSLAIGDEFWQVGIEFTYEGANGEPLEGWQTCNYAIVDGAPDISRFLETDSSYEQAAAS
jgi:hypothetical protein